MEHTSLSMEYVEIAFYFAGPLIKQLIYKYNDDFFWIYKLADLTQLIYK